MAKWSDFRFPLGENLCLGSNPSEAAHIKELPDFMWQSNIAVNGVRQTLLCRHESLATCTMSPHPGEAGRESRLRRNSLCACSHSFSVCVSEKHSDHGSRRLRKKSCKIAAHSFCKTPEVISDR